MRKLFKALVYAFIAFFMALIMVTAFFGAALQESYKLNPPTVAEIGE